MSAAIRRERLARQWIDGARGPSPLAVVRHLGALQAQDYPAALWAIGLRSEQPSLRAVEEAFARGEIVRTWPLRGTLQIVPAEDVRWLLALTSQRVLDRARRRLEQLELSEADLVRCERLLERALRDGATLTRDGAMEVLERGKIGTRGQRGYHILFQLAVRGAICFGPQRGKQLTVVLLDRWASAQRSLRGDEALAELATRFFRSRAPATAEDFAWWAGLTLREARRAKELADVETSEPIASRRSAQLLPGFDEYLLGYKDRGAVLTTEHAARIVPGQNGVFLPLLVVEGRVAGTWKRKATKRAVKLELTPFSPLSKWASAALLAAAGRYGAFLGTAIDARIC